MNDELLVKFLIGEASPEEAAAVTSWIEKSQENTRHFKQLQLIWENSREITSRSTVDENAAWHRFQGRLQKEKTPVIQISSRRRFFRVAAVLLILISTAAMAYLIYNHFSNPVTQTLAAVEHPVTQSLPDGSSIVLNKNSSLTYPSSFKSETRTVVLKGEGFFNVEPDRKKPFIVKVNELTITVVGTSFNIKESNGRTEVIVESGVVKVSGKNQTIELHRHEKISISKNDSLLHKEIQTDKLYNYYRSKTFVCDNTPLWKLVDVLQEAYGVRIEIRNPDIRNLPLNTTFNEEPIEHIVNIISQTFDITVHKEGNSFILQ